MLKPKEVIRVFKKFGWVVARSSGSHIILTKEGNISTLSIPNHDEIARGTLRALIDKSGLTIEDFIKEL
ncbi:MAG: type II toxin-antitoxin system HicA family toxin [Candidatus Hydromicrobium sp.]